MTDTTDEWSFKGLSKPGYSQMPNELYDDIQPRIDPYTFSVVSAIYREYFGWHAEAPKPLSLNELIRRTGLSRNRVIKSIKEAERKRIIVCVRSELQPDLKDTNRYAPNILDEGVVHGENYGGAPEELPLVHDKNYPSSPHEPGGSSPHEPIQIKGKKTTKEREPRVRTRTPKDDLFDAFAILMNGAKTPEQVKRLSVAAKTHCGKLADEWLRDGFAPVDILAFRDWWLQDPWRAKNIPYPTPNQFRDNWPKFYTAYQKQHEYEAWQAQQSNGDPPDLGDTPTDPQTAMRDLFAAAASPGVNHV